MFKIEARPVDGILGRQRKATAERILAYFAGHLPNLKLFCFLDEEDWDLPEDIAGKASRGFFTRTRKSIRLWPERQLWPVYLRPRHAFDCVIYLPGNTCAVNVGLTMTLAHELQHFCQYGNQRGLWAVNTLLKHLPSQANVQLNAWDIPFEQDARIVSKRAAECLCGEEPVREYIAAKISTAIEEADVDNWKFVQQQKDFIYLRPIR
jgi:hypothetical protein